MAIDARAAIERAAGGMHADDLIEQCRVLLNAHGGTAMAPGVIAGTRDAVEPAHQRDFVGFPVCFDELEDFRF